MFGICPRRICPGVGIFLVIDVGSQLWPAAVESARKRLPEATSHRVISPCMVTVAIILPSELKLSSTGDMLKRRVCVSRPLIGSQIFNSLEGSRPIICTPFEGVYITASERCANDRA